MFRFIKQPWTQKYKWSLVTKKRSQSQITVFPGHRKKKWWINNKTTQRQSFSIISKQTKNKYVTKERSAVLLDRNLAINSDVAPNNKEALPGGGVGGGGYLLSCSPEKKIGIFPCSQKSKYWFYMFPVPKNCLYSPVPFSFRFVFPCSP